MKNKNPIIAYLNLGATADDTADVQTLKRVLVGLSTLAIILGSFFGWRLIAQKEQLAGIGLEVWSAASALLLIHMGYTHNHKLQLYYHLITILVGPFLLTVLLGGVVQTAIIWFSFISPLLALLALDLRKAAYWFYGFLLILATTIAVNPYIPRNTNLTENFTYYSRLTALFIFPVTAYFLLRYFISQRNTAYRLLSVEQERSENLLLNILPKEIADVLKVEERTIADHCDQASILFADLVGFTPLTAELNPPEMIELLNKIFSYFDMLVEKYGLEKIRTIGDSYMVASGVPRPREDHAEAMADMALEMLECARRVPLPKKNINFRIGINSGPLVAGVIGRRKFHYDVWGDAVNTASRMESHGVAGKIQVTDTTYELLKGKFELEPRGFVDVKGKGEMRTWFLMGKIKTHT